MWKISRDERRARLSRRQLGDGIPPSDAVALAESLVGLHASDPATVYLAARARIPELTVADLESALYDDRALVRHHGMRQTLFVLPTGLVPVIQAACTDAMTRAERSRLARDVERGGIAPNGARWVRSASAATLEALRSLGSATGSELARQVPELRAKLVYGQGKRWGGEVGVGGRVLTVLAAEGLIVRGRPAGSWTSSRHRWELAPGRAAGPPEAEAQTELVRRWLMAFGPATARDVAWWTGLPAGKARTALASAGAFEVELDGEIGFILDGDTGPEPGTEPRAAFLPSLDPTTMGWKERGWYLGPHEDDLFDRRGNAGPTVWWDGRIVGGWAQRRSGEVEFRLLEDVGSSAVTAIENEAGRLEAWIGDARVTPRFPTPLESTLRTA